MKKEKQFIIAKDFFLQNMVMINSLFTNSVMKELNSEIFVLVAKAMLLDNEKKQLKKKLKEVEKLIKESL